MGINGLTVVLPPASALVGSRYPRIGYINAGVGATVTATSTATDFDPANVFDWKPYTGWTPATAGTHYINVTPASTPNVNYFAVAHHTLGDNGGTIQLQYSTDGGSTWNDATDVITPTGQEMLWRSFNTISTASMWRVKVVSTPVSYIGVISFGEQYQPYYGELPGFTPPALAREITPYSTGSEGGLMLGRSIISRHVSTEFTFNNMSAADAHAGWLAFMKHAELYPFFIAWLLEDYPTDIAYVESNGRIPMPKFTSHGRMTCSISVRGYLNT